MPFFVLHEQLELELAVAGALGDAAGLEGLERLGDQTVGFGDFQTQRVAFGLVLHVDALEDSIHLFGELLGLLLRDGLVGKFIVELVTQDAQVSETDEETGLESGLLFRFAHRLNELALVQFLSCDGDNAVHLLDEMHGRGVLEVRSDFQQVIHVVAVKSSKSGDIRAITLALFQFVQLQEGRGRVVEVVLADELVVVEVREEHCVYGVVEH